MDARTPLSFVCRLDALSPAERVRHAELTARLVDSARRIDGLENGWALSFDGGPEAGWLIEWMARERRCCPFLDFDIDLGEPGEPAVVRLTGAPGVRDFLAAELGLEPAAR
ncbi:MAG TPA: hypothetical protein VIA45_10080 [Thermoanaerobaculia bacterium]